MSKPFALQGSPPPSGTAPTGCDAAKLLNALPHPVVAVLPDGLIAEANSAAEAFFGMSRTSLWQQRLANLVVAFSPLLSLVEQVKSGGAAINEYQVALNLAKPGGGRLVDIFVTPLHEPADGVVIMLQERSLSEKIDRQLTHRGAGRSVAAMASVLAHEIKNPLSGIRGAAQLLEAEATDPDRTLTRLICEETDRIVKLVDRMSAFSEGRPVGREKVNIHAVLDHVKKVSQAGFARHIRFHENYDPSLPAILGNKDQLIQIFLNLVKNAAEAIGESRPRRRHRINHRFPARRAPATSGRESAGEPAAGILRARQWVRRRAGIVTLSVRSLRHHESGRNWPGACFGCQDCWRSRWYHRMRILSPPHDVPGSHAHVCPGQGVKHG